MLSIIIPIYNREDLLPETLDSVVRQTRGDWECLLVDDHSTDATPEIAREYCEKDARFRFFRRPDEKRKGPSSCRNVGFEHAKGEFIYFLDSDDIIGERFIETFVPELEAYPQRDYVLFRFVRFEGDITKVVRRSGLLPAEMSIPEAMASFRIAQGTQYFIWRRCFLAQQPNLWREDLSFGEDRELNFRLVSAARNGCFLPEPVLVYYRRNRRGLCFVRRFDKGHLLDTLEVCKSFLAISRQGNVRDGVKTAYARYLARNMREALKFGDRELMEQFYQIAKELLPDRKTQKKLERLHRYPGLYALMLRPPLILSMFISRFFRLFT